MIKLFFLPHQLNLYTSYFLNSTVAIKNAEEEIALTLKGKKSNLKAADFIAYYAKKRLQLNEKNEKYYTATNEESKSKMEGIA